jgi:hypothetical protein
MLQGHLCMTIFVLPVLESQSQLLSVALAVHTYGGRNPHIAKLNANCTTCHLMSALYVSGFMSHFTEEDTEVPKRL